MIALGGVLVLLRPSPDEGLAAHNMAWIMGLFGLILLSHLAMRYAGLFAASWTESGYHPLGPTLPWSYNSYLLRCASMIGGLTELAIRRFALRDFHIGFIAALVIAPLYNLPFEDLILAPNGDG